MEAQSLVSQVLMSWAPMSLYWLVWFIVPGAAAAYYAYQDGIKRMPLAMGVHPGWWALFCFVSGSWGLLAYWVMHHSSLVKGGPSEKPYIKFAHSRSLGRRYRVTEKVTDLFLSVTSQRDPERSATESGSELVTSTE